jgi:hypothetical protein
MRVRLAVLAASIWLSAVAPNWAGEREDLVGMIAEMQISKLDPEVAKSGLLTEFANALGAKCANLSADERANVELSVLTSLHNSAKQSFVSLLDEKRFSIQEILDIKAFVESDPALGDEIRVRFLATPLGQKFTLLGGELSRQRLPPPTYQETTSGIRPDIQKKLLATFAAPGGCQ